MEYIIKNSDLIYCHMQDDYSRFLYEKRVMWSITKDAKYLSDILDTMTDKECLKEIMQKADKVKNKLAIRGVGNDYWVLKRLYPDLNFAFFVDNDLTKIGKEIDGKKVLSPQEFYNSYEDYHVLVNSMAANGEIVSELLANGVKEENIINVADSYADVCDKQYFEKDLLPVYDEEVFVDGGCYDGRTIRQFVKYCDGRYKKIFSFEPDEGNYERTMKILEEHPIDRLTVFNKGLWDTSTTLCFAANSNQASRIVDDGVNKIETVSIDEAVGDERVTFIKLDVEGAEYKALEGARRAITNNHPKLAISIYHKPEDIFELPELILSMDDSYRFYMRHYQLSPNETILYGV